MKNTKIITVSLAAALAIGAITANGVLVSADAEKGTIKVAASATPPFLRHTNDDGIVVLTL